MEASRLSSGIHVDRALVAHHPAVGTGNGQLLFAFSSAGYTCLTGIDYSPLSIELANNILSARTSSSDGDLASPPPRFFTADILNVADGKEVEGVTGARWDLVTDKGTYDAVCLSDELRGGKSLRELYVESVAKLLPKGGLFLITSCGSNPSSLGVLSKLMGFDRQLDPSRAGKGVCERVDRCVCHFFPCGARLLPLLDDSKTLFRAPADYRAGRRPRGALQYPSSKL